MRICYAYDVALPNAHTATIQILKTGAALCDLGHPFDFLCGPAPDSATGMFDALGIGVPQGLAIEAGFPRLPRWPALRAPVLRRCARRFLRRRACDVMVSRGETGIALARAPRGGHARFVLEVHKLRSLELAERAAGTRIDPGDLRRSPAFRAEAEAFRQADGVLFLTPGVRDAAERVFGPLDVPATVVPSGTDAPRPSGGAEGPRHDLIYAGKIERRKGLFLMLDAMRHLPGRRLTLLGGGADLEEGRRYAARHGLGDRVRFAGPVPHAQVAGELARARLGLSLLPDDVDHVSTSFTSPMKILEMMAAGLPVVATDLPSVRNICRHGADSVLVAPRPEPIAAAITRLLHDPGTMARLAEAGRRRAADFAWTARARRIADFCEGLLDSPSSGRGRDPAHPPHAR